MKSITKSVITIAFLLGFMGSLPSTSFAYGSDGNDWRERNRQVRFEQNGKRQDRIYANFDKNKSRKTERLQRLIDRENRIECVSNNDIVQNNHIVENYDIVETLSQRGNFTTLLAAAGAADLVDTLKSDGKFTLFAPTDQAFAKLPAGTVEALLNDIPTLTAILKYHVVASEVPADVAKTLTSATTVNGQNVSISIQDGSLFINDSKVILNDIKTKNGVIHVIDTVLLPS